MRQYINYRWFIIWTNARIRPWEQTSVKSFNQNVFIIFTNMHLEMSGNWRPFCFVLNFLSWKTCFWCVMRLCIKKWLADFSELPFAIYRNLISFSLLVVCMPVGYHESGWLPRHYVRTEVSRLTAPPIGAGYVLRTHLEIRGDTLLV